MILCGSLFKSANCPGKGKAAAAVANRELLDCSLLFITFECLPLVCPFFIYVSI
jgi:hypothetical protein